MFHPIIEKNAHIENRAVEETRYFQAPPMNTLILHSRAVT
jgi:hypothetical protein